MAVLNFGFVNKLIIVVNPSANLFASWAVRC